MGNNNSGVIESKREKSVCHTKKVNHFLNATNLPGKEINCFEGMGLNSLCLMRFLCPFWQRARLQKERGDQPIGTCLTFYTFYSLSFLIFTFFLFFFLFFLNVYLFCYDSFLEVTVTMLCIFFVVLTLIPLLCTTRPLFIVPAMTKFYRISL